MGRIFSVFCVGILTASFAMAEIDLEGDLSGFWKLEVSEKPGEQFEFFFIKSGWKPLAKGSTLSHYLVQSSGIASMNPSGAFIGKAENGKVFIHWLLFKEKGLESESTMILRQEGDTLILGGDHEEFELARMTRLTL